MPLPRPTDRYFGTGPMELARLSHKFEDEENDVEFLAVQDAVALLPEGLHRLFRQAYIDMHKRR